MTSEGKTESGLKKKCVQVGEHLYMKPSEKIDLSSLGSLASESLAEEDKNKLQVVFLMGGGGTRLMHITKDEYSKHLIEVGGKPISRHVFDMWVSNGFGDFCFLIDDTHRGTGIMNYYKSGEELGANVKIEYSIEHMKLGSGGALRLAIENGKITKPFVIHFPDDVIVNYTNFPADFIKIFTAALSHGYHCVVCCVPGKLYPYGVIIDKGGDVVDFVEKPFIRKDTNIGVIGLSRESLATIAQLEPNKEIKIERTMLRQMAKSGHMLKVLLPTEYWIPVNDEPNLNKFVEIVKTSKVKSK
jgi:NDP-sugar pyrophosphorylase family protein